MACRRCVEPTFANFSSHRYLHTVAFQNYVFSAGTGPAPCPSGLEFYRSAAYYYRLPCICQPCTLPITAQ